MERANSISDYIARFPPDIRERLQMIRNMIKELVPGAVEVISYGMPAFKYKKKILLYFAAFTNHTGFYATPEANIAFEEEISHYKTGKGSIQFPHNLPLPLDLMAKLVLYKVALIDMKTKS